MDSNSSNDDSNRQCNKEKETNEPYLTIHNTPIFFSDQWKTGIGGGLWSTGLAMALYFKSHPMPKFLQRLILHKGRTHVSALELGSGNGCLSICLAASARDVISELIVTDLEDHLELIRRNINRNNHVMDLRSSTLSSTATTTAKYGKTVKTIIMEHQWGKYSNNDSSNNNHNHKDSIQHQLQTGIKKFDFIFGSDLAYEETLYQPLISSLLKFSHESTVSLIGVCMHDTTPQFFTDLRLAGFRYERIADHEMDVKFRGNIFGLFVIWKKCENKT